ncbi:hypothetical protein AN1V17_35450 [Vallitalea sediminicola]|uniref:Uncharacterized protein n=1 Tax=Vallitalea maricola TaxID=3074433 RepID=A0ACB5UMZ4_9FIRM|nr:hypothetical protein AN2V17_31440 [Vallitalea sp. AN17-2]
MSEKDLNLQEQENDEKDLNEELEIDKGNAEEESCVHVHLT